MLAVLVLFAGCATARPSATRQWSPDQALLPSAQFADHLVHVRNIRNCEYRTADDYTVRHYDRTFDLDQVESVDFVVVPFAEFQSGAHTFLSFGFADGQRLGVSVEVRREKGEQYSALRSLVKPYELMYVVADERDLIGLRAIHRLDDVYLYRTKARPADARRLLVDVLGRVNQLQEKPEFYNLVTNNCTTNIRRHVNRIWPNRVPYSYQVLLPGYADRLAYDKGLLDSGVPFEELKERARINELVFAYRDSANFSQLIRR